MAVQFSPKILGLNVGNLRTVFGQSEDEFRDYFRKSKAEFWDCFWTVRD